MHWKDWCWNWNSNTLATWCKELTHLKRPWCWERLKAGGEGDNRGWDGSMASLTQWTWVWVSSGSWWWMGRPGMLQSMGSQRVTHHWVTNSFTFSTAWRTVLQQLIKKENHRPSPTPLQYKQSSFSTVVNFLDTSCRLQSTGKKAPIQRQFILRYCKWY